MDHERSSDLRVHDPLDINSGAAVLLANKYTAENIFWAVHGDIAVGTYAHAEGIMLTYTMIALHTGSSLNESAYAQTVVTLDDVTMNRVITRLCAPAEVPSDSPTGSPVVSLSEKSTFEWHFHLFPSDGIMFFSFYSIHLEATSPLPKDELTTVHVFEGMSSTILFEILTTLWISCIFWSRADNNV